MEGSLEVSIKQCRGVPVVSARGELDVATVPQLAAALGGLGEDVARVVVDLADVTFVDSSGLGALIAARVRPGGARTVAIVSDRPAVVRAFAITSLDSIFPIHSTLDAALAP